MSMGLDCCLAYSLISTHIGDYFNKTIASCGGGGRGEGWGGCYSCLSSKLESPADTIQFHAEKPVLIDGRLCKGKSLNR